MQVKCDCAVHITIKLWDRIVNVRSFLFTAQGDKLGKSHVSPRCFRELVWRLSFVF